MSAGTNVLIHEGGKVVTLQSDSIEACAQVCDALMAGAVGLKGAIASHGKAAVKQLPQLPATPFRAGIRPGMTLLSVAGRVRAPCSAAAAAASADSPAAPGPDQLLCLRSSPLGCAA